MCINLDAITTAEMTQGKVAIFFIGDPTPSILRGEAAESFWRCLRGSVLTIHHATPGAAQSTKIAEVPPRQDSSD
ncbi:hypothetical protein [Nostoc sp. T09]|uniref:hypothetical protein n=1 Tax=Nostoc sp. T09 TaxID=1932621 RepID=UPI00117D6AB3|nr:hypothetical protein [Nostoc sp. T09]